MGHPGAALTLSSKLIFCLDNNRKLQEKIRELGEEFSWDKIIRGTLELWAS